MFVGNLLVSQSPFDAAVSSLEPFADHFLTSIECLARTIQNKSYIDLSSLRNPWQVHLLIIDHLGDENLLHVDAIKIYELSTSNNRKRAGGIAVEVEQLLADAQAGPAMARHWR